jgi:hypothetical protein
MQKHQKNQVADSLISSKLKTHILNRQDYEDRYDKMTVEDCRQSERFFMQVGGDDTIENKLKSGVAAVAWEIKKLYLTLDWYNKREATILEWMSEDEIRDKKLAVAVPPKGISCSTCGDRLNEDSRTTWVRDDVEEVLFFMRCSQGHLPMKGVFEDGVELSIKDKFCPKCSALIDCKRLPSKKEVIKTKYSCTQCSYEEVDVFTLSNEKIADDPDFEKDKTRFCLSGDRLKEAQESMYSIERMSRLVEGWKHKEEHEAEYEAVAKLEKLTIPQVKERIATTLEGTAYLNLSFEKPLVELYVSVEFSVEEMQTDNPRASISNLQKRIKKALEHTNWRLMTGGIDYRLGLLSGRLRAYETEEDLLKLVS